MARSERHDIAGYIDELQADETEANAEFCWSLRLYGPEQCARYRGKHIGALSPHPYALADAAYRALVSWLNNKLFRSQAAQPRFGKKTTRPSSSPGRAALGRLRRQRLCFGQHMRYESEEGVLGMFPECESRLEMK